MSWSQKKLWAEAKLFHGRNPSFTFPSLFCQNIFLSSERINIVKWAFEKNSFFSLKYDLLKFDTGLFLLSLVCAKFIMKCYESF